MSDDNPFHSHKKPNAAGLTIFALARAHLAMLREKAAAIRATCDECDRAFADADFEPMVNAQAKLLALISEISAVMDSIQTTLQQLHTLDPEWIASLQPQIRQALAEKQTADLIVVQGTERDAYEAVKRHNAECKDAKCPALIIERMLAARLGIDTGRTVH